MRPRQRHHREVEGEVGEGEAEEGGIGVAAVVGEGEGVAHHQVEGEGAVHQQAEVEGVGVVLTPGEGVGMEATSLMVTVGTREEEEEGMEEEVATNLNLTGRCRKLQLSVHAAILYLSPFSYNQGNYQVNYQHITIVAGRSNCALLS